MYVPKYNDDSDTFIELPAHKVLRTPQYNNSYYHIAALILEAFELEAEDDDDDTSSFWDISPDAALITNSIS